jgi:hypothetical protein
MAILSLRPGEGSAMADSYHPMRILDIFFKKKRKESREKKEKRRKGPSNTGTRSLAGNLSMP